MDVLGIKIVGHGPTSMQHLIYFFSKVKILNVYTITGGRHHSFDLSQVELEVPCTLCFSGDAKLGRSYKLSASTYINNIRF